MRRYSPAYHSPPRRGYGSSWPRSPPRRGSGGHGRGRGSGGHGSLLVRNIPLDCRPEELRIPFERFGLVRDVYLPKDYYTGEPRGFAFVQFVDPYEAAEAQYQMNGRIFAGREISVVVASEMRKRPEDMRRKSSLGGRPVSYGGRQSTYHGYSRSRSRSPRYPSGSRSRHRSRSFSPMPRRRRDYSVSPDRRHIDRPRYPGGHLQDRHIVHNQRSYSPGYVDMADQGVNVYEKRSEREAEEALGHRRSPAGRASRSPPGSRSRSADTSPRHAR
ncbi:OLC1v1027620C3 [Oldenlandia corymbosa var. corymbosa]|uniref:OLC1v1027620C3 n=1 Tax=Oldenlandia corymbosa var. corymbosa TaxID=529605 RepID=A0AAV1CBR3_OLDCO|nr:OLC1v1027620C3 [Oldenlandia corymbosa var. corymbosa]